MVTDLRDVEAADRAQAGRLASWLFLLAGSITFLNTWLPVFASGHPAVVRLTSSTAMIVGLVCLRLPWYRWPMRASLLLVPVALTIIGVFRAAGSTDGYTFSVYFVIVFTWAGVAQPRWTAVWIAPLAVVAYVLALLAAPGHTSADIASVTVTIPACVLVAETIARTVERLRFAQADGRRQAQDLEALAGVASILQGEAKAATLGPLVASTAASILHADRVGVWLGPEAAVLTPVGFAGISEEPIEIGLSPTVAAAVLLSGQVGTIPDGGPFAGGLLVPLLGSAGPLGLMAVALGEWPADAFTTHVAQLFGTQAGIRFEQLRVVETLTQEAMQDPLTGVGNRRWASVILDRLRPGDAVVLIDLDHFKRVNDTLGHAAGDEVLVRLGNYLRKQLRGSDEIARYGGEEFIAVLRESGVRAIDTAERLVAQWRDLTPPPAATCSAGIAVHEIGRTPAATLGRADAALYRAKRNGRDQALADDVVRQH